MPGRGGPPSRRGRARCVRGGGVHHRGRFGQWTSWSATPASPAADAARIPAEEIERMMRVNFSGRFGSPRRRSPECSSGDPGRWSTSRRWPPPSPTRVSRTTGHPRRPSPAGPTGWPSTCTTPVSTSRRSRGAHRHRDLDLDEEPHLHPPQVPTRGRVLGRRRRDPGRSGQGHCAPPVRGRRALYPLLGKPLLGPAPLRGPSAQPLGPVVLRLPRVVAEDLLHPLVDLGV